MNRCQLPDLSDVAVRAIAASLLLSWHLPIAAQGCDSLDSLRENTSSNFSKIIGTKLDDDGEFSSPTSRDAPRATMT